MSQDKGLQGLAPQQRHVARQQHERAPGPRQGVFRLQQGVCRAELRFLHDVPHIQVRPRLHDLRLVTHDHGERRGIQGSRRPQHRLQHRPATHGVKHLGQAGFHPRALTRRQNDDVAFRHWRDASGRGAPLAQARTLAPPRECQSDGNAPILSFGLIL